jgi:hypothetical protein
MAKTAKNNEAQESKINLEIFNGFFFLAAWR